LRDAVIEYDVFARSSPEHKLRLVEAMQSHGEVVAMTGDGVNDAPALKRADVGVAMGIKGSEASKEAAAMVLADDNFVTIEHAVEEGRTIYDNLKKTILFILPTNGAEALIVLATVLFAFRQLPITPVQILWVNMITAVTLALSMAFEPSEKGIMRRPPRDPNEPIVSGYLLWRIGFVSVLVACFAIGLFFYELDNGISLLSARTMAVNVLVTCQLFYLFNSRFIMQSSLSIKGLLSNRAALLAVGLLVVFQVLFTYAAPFQLWFGTEGIRLVDWLLILGAGLAVYLLVEVEKAVVRRMQTKG
jgi:magnesium-transporting ATPase (P-type)